MSKLSLTSPAQLPTRIPTGAPTAAPSGAASGPAAALARPGQSANPAKMAKSAQDFEAMAIGQLLQPMFDTVNTAKSGFGGGAGEEAWKPMLIQEFAKQIAAHGGLGLAKPVYDAMQRMQEAKPK
jgi:Rod binding domain-containing protein